ncbi:MAG: hypothetical protein HYZ01_07555 [Ignavibacteriales bacterium]|nr:hypothetical protein [Ignavibacteriales bacterium]
MKPTVSAVSLLLLFCGFLVGEAAAQGVIISGPGTYTTDCGKQAIRPSYTITPVELKNLSKEKERIRKEIKATGAFPWVNDARPGQSYAIALVTKKNDKNCTLTTVMWRIVTGDHAVKKLDQDARNEPYYFSHSIQVSKVLK